MSREQMLAALSSALSKILREMWASPVPIIPHPAPSVPKQAPRLVPGGDKHKLHVLVPSQPQEIPNARGRFLSPAPGEERWSGDHFEGDVLAARKRLGSPRSFSPSRNGRSPGVFRRVGSDQALSARGLRFAVFPERLDA
eukprot:GABV01006784.1.p1 GENE.GABV01006784.1~~GABV01006784.1.p1  ORF type:complete len:140 (-),score=32.30 GABV01006784.1:3-422(-)